MLSYSGRTTIWNVSLDHTGAVGQLPIMVNENHHLILSILQMLRQVAYH